MDYEPTISFADGLEHSAWYDINVTAAVRDALENREPLLGIRIVASENDTGAFYFGSRERAREPPQLVVCWTTAAFTGRPTDRPTFVPTSSPATLTSAPRPGPPAPLDCMDGRGTFVAITGTTAQGLPMDLLTN